MQREAVYEKIKAHLPHIQTVVVPAKRIDEVNILEATFEGMVDAVEGMGFKPDEVLVDGPHVPTAWKLKLPKMKKAMKSKNKSDADPVDVGTGSMVNGDTKSEGETSGDAGIKPIRIPSPPEFKVTPVIKGDGENLSKLKLLNQVALQLLKLIYILIRLRK